MPLPNIPGPVVQTYVQYVLCLVALSTLVKPHQPLLRDRLLGGTSGAAEDCIPCVSLVCPDRGGNCNKKHIAKEGNSLTTYSAGVYQVTFYGFRCFVGKSTSKESVTDSQEKPGVLDSQQTEPKTSTLAEDNIHWSSDPNQKFPKYREIRLQVPCWSIVVLRCTA